MPFGKYKGRLLQEIGDQYLYWLLSLQDLKQNLRIHVFDEMTRRGHMLQPESRFYKFPPADGYSAPPPFDVPPAQSPPKPDLSEVAKRWRRQMAIEYHPDIDGSHDEMLVVERGYELLTKILEGLVN